ncbi:MAG TPA: hypothetical protein VKY65_18800 [Alphaproteobacteria bacterium]|nr:hypothetical protein [Alphaproteobacteria bacterium]
MFAASSSSFFILRLPQARDAPRVGVYRFRGAGGAVAWPMRDGANLGLAGAWNLLFRLGFLPQVVALEGLPRPRRGDVLVVPAQPGNDLPIGSLQEWHAAGGMILASGATEAWSGLLGASLRVVRAGYPYAALAAGGVEKVPQVVAPPGWPFLAGEAGRATALGYLLALRGERQTPQRALITPLTDAPAVLRHDGIVYLNGDPFAAYQAWLQGQEDLGPWLNWRHRLFWLDEQAAFLGRLLRRAEVVERLPGPGIPSLAETTIVLRHDLDASRDTAYLEAEVAAGIPAVHAILHDENTDFWLKALARHDDHETALHYHTNTEPARWRRRVPFLRRSSSRSGPAHRRLVGRGLARQVEWAHDRGIGVATLHRHWSYILYPELVDALDAVYRTLPDVTGSSSFFRGQVLRWGARDAGESVGSFPDAQFPSWLPFRLAHAGDDGRMLAGWESTSVMEIEPDLLEQMLDHHIPELAQRVFTLCFHPAHARRPTFTPQGSLADFRRILGIIRARSLPCLTLAEVYRRFSAAAQQQGGAP